MCGLCGYAIFHIMKWNDPMILLLNNCFYLVINTKMCPERLEDIVLLKEEFEKKTGDVTTYIICTDKKIAFKK